MTLLVRFEIRVPARVQVDVDGVPLPRVHVTGHGGQKAGDVAGATGHAEPGTALVLAVRLERVRIEESLAVERHARNEPVVKRALHHVDVFRVAVQQEQPVVPVVHADRRTRFVVRGHVRQLVVTSERFAGARRADAARDVELRADRVLPDRVDRFHVRRVPGQRRHIRHARVHVGGAHGMPDRFRLLDHPLLRLVVREAAGVHLFTRARPALVQHELGQRQIAVVARDAIQLRQTHLGDLVTRPDRSPAGAEGLDEQVRALERDVEQGALARGLIVRGGRFIEVPEVVELVAVVALELPPVLPRPRVRARGVDGAGGVEVAVALLRRGDFFDQAVDVGIQLRIRPDAQRIGSALDDLVQVGIVEGIPRRLRVLERLVAERLRRPDEILDATGELALLERERNRLGAIGLDARRPEHIGEVNGGEGHRLDGIVAPGLCAERCQWRRLRRHRGRGQRGERERASEARDRREFRPKHGVL